MEQRFDRLEAQLDEIMKDLRTLTVAHENRITKLETTQKGVIALCGAILTAALASFAKALHLGS